MILSDFPEIPEDRIAVHPPADREQARLLALHRSPEAVEHRVFADIVDYFDPGDVLVLNNARVVPARLEGRKPTGGRVRVLLLKKFPAEAEGERWSALVTPRPRPGAEILFKGGLRARVAGRLPEGENEVVFARSVSEALDRIGQMPLPPYIPRVAGEGDDRDRADYQTVFAREHAVPDDGRPHAVGAVAAPTAGLHFTLALLGRLRAKGVNVVFLTLWVGWGTFRPLTDPDPRRHRMLPEEFDLSPETAEMVNDARDAGGKVWACGTTAVRALESRAGEDGRLHPGHGETSLFILPGHRFRMVDRLITNFHLPRHTPLYLAAAFAGADPLRRAYGEALQKGYRFLSYGDAMAIL